jgi:restriction endonuclease S subunit
MNTAWNRVPLPDVAWFQEGPGLRNWQWTDQGIKVINGRNILTDGQIDLSNTDKFISWAEYREKYEHFGVALNDILVTSSGTLGKVGRIKSEHLPLVMNTSVIRFRPKQDAPLDRDYLYCFLRSGDFQDQISSYAIGAAQPNYGPSHLKLMTLPLPPLPVQRRIASILESMARALYREWFVHFRFPDHENHPRVASPLGEIPEGWEASTLGAHLAALESGKRPKGGIREVEDGVPSIGAENINGIGQHDFAGEKFIPREFFLEMRKGIVRDRDVAIYKDGAYIGKSSYFRDGFPHVECCVNEHVFLLRANGVRLKQNALYLWLQEPDTVQTIRSKNANAAQPGINQQTVGGLELTLPDLRVASKFDELVDPLLAEVVNLDTLAEARGLGDPHHLIPDTHQLAPNTHQLAADTHQLCAAPPAVCGRAFKGFP